MSDKTPEDPSTKMQVYLAKIYRLADFAGTGDYVTTSALADTLMVTAPAVNRMVNRLKEAGLLDHEPYKGIRLTDKGRHEALLHLRVQRITEAFMVSVMSIAPADVHDLANGVSPTLGEVIVTRMDTMAGHPSCCPHGEPIPDAAGTIVTMDDHPLSQVPPNSSAIVTRMRTRESDRLRYIEALGLVPGTPLEVLHIAPFNGPLQLKIRNEYRIVGNNLAELIRVRIV